MMRAGAIARVFAPLIGVVGFLALWQLIVVVREIPAYQLPKPSDILSHINDEWGFYVRNARVTIVESLLGFGIAFVVALVVATAMAHSQFLDDAIQPVAVLLQVTPIIAYAPAIVIWLNFGLKTDRRRHVVGLLRADPAQRRHRAALGRPEPARARALGRRNPHRGLLPACGCRRRSRTCSRRPRSRSAWR